MPSPLREFVAETEKIVRSYSTESEILRGIRHLMKEVLEGPSIPGEAFRERSDRFANNLIYAPKDRVFSVNGAVWLPGQTTPIHDHLTWAMVGLYDGEEHESIYRRTDDHSNPNMAMLEKVSEQINGKGHITTLGEAGIHRIDNVSNLPSRSIHVYGIDIGAAERHSYDPVTGRVSRFVSGYCNVLRDEDLD